MDNKRFHEQLNEYLEELDCTAKELGEVSGVSLPHSAGIAPAAGYRTRAPRLLTAYVRQSAE